MNVNQNIPIGAEVCSQDGDKIGSVKSVRGEHFKVDAPMQGDYWLSANTIASAAGGRVNLSISKDRLGDHKVDLEEAEESKDASIVGAGIPFSDTAKSPTGSGSSMGAPIVPYAADLRGWEEAGPTYRQSWQSRPENSSGRWEDVEPGYRYAHEMRSDPRYQGRAWQDVEPSLGSSYPAWAQERGYQQSAGAWVRLKEHARQGWQPAKRDDAQGSR
ncbi:MAG: hypothetical protein ACR2PL_14290 [Dehalococcoidia bacterium]